MHICIYARRRRAYISSIYLYIRPWALCPVGVFIRSSGSLGRLVSWLYRAPPPGLLFAGWVALPFFGTPNPPKSLKNNWFFNVFGGSMGGPNVEVLEHFGSWGPLGAKLAQDPSKRPPKTDFGRFWTPTWWILGSTLLDFG